MTPGEFREFAQIMRDYGLTSVKMGDVELIIAADAKPVEQVAQVTQSPPGEEDPIKHKVEELTSLLKLNDMDLVDTLFPVIEADESEMVT